MLKDLGGDPSDFAARRLNARCVSEADLILGLTTAHRNAVLELAPHKLHRTFNLSEAAVLISDYGARSVSELADLRSRLSGQESIDIMDPIGQDRNVFADIGAQIAELLPPVLEVCRGQTERMDR